MEHSQCKSGIQAGCFPKKELTDIYREIDEPNGFTLNIIIILIIPIPIPFPEDYAFTASISLCSTTCCAMCVHNIRVRHGNH